MIAMGEELRGKDCLAAAGCSATMVVRTARQTAHHKIVEGLNAVFTRSSTASTAELTGVVIPLPRCFRHDREIFKDLSSITDIADEPAGGLQLSSASVGVARTPARSASRDW